MHSCRLCHHDSLELTIDFGMQPIVHNLMRSPDEATALYPFKLASCRICGFLQLVDFIEPDILYKNYFTISAWKSQPHVPRLLDEIEQIYHLHAGTRILEIGCNDGTFLEQLRARGYGELIGVEPTEDAFSLAQKRNLHVYRDFFDTTFVQKELASQKKFDLIVTRQVLEHIGDLADFMGCAREVLVDGGGLVIEVPDCGMNLESLDYALWEEHPNYFTLNTLRMLVERSGFVVVHHEATLFSGKAILLFAIKANARDWPLTPFDQPAIDNYRASWPLLRAAMRNHIEAMDAKVYVYGCGARSSTVVNFMGMGDLIECYVDDQPEKQEKYVPGSRLAIRPFDETMRIGSFFLLGVNTENERKAIGKRGLSHHDVMSILPPSRLLPHYWSALAKRAG